MIISKIFVVLFFRLTNCLNLSADNIYCVLYRTWTDYRIINASNAEKVLKQNIFNTSLKTAFYITGEGTPIDSPLIRPLIQSYIRSKRYNFIQLYGGYYTVNRNASGLYGKMMHWLGELYGSVISKLIKIGLPVESIELIGESYGANIATLTAKHSFPKLPLLIGLDPSPWINFQKGYTDYTIALHTNMGFMGTRFYNQCDSDLIVNDGTMQPKCTDRNILQIPSEDEKFNVLLCCHVSSGDYWGLMVEIPELFYGIEYSESNCNYNNIKLLGPNLRSPGIFYFKTSKYFPFGLGIEGIKNITPVDIDLLNVYYRHGFQLSFFQQRMKKYISDQYDYRHNHTTETGLETLYYR